jgi:putative transposase
VHLLIADQDNQEIAASMQLIASRVAQEYNQRKNRKGAFWEDRYHATAVQTDHHLIRCMSYIDLNMVRAGVVRHPREWETSGFCEIQVPPERKGVIDFRTLCNLTGVATEDQLQRIHRRWAADAQMRNQRNPVWTETAGVGDENFLVQLKQQLGATGLYKKVTARDGLNYLMEANGPYASVFTLKKAD